MNEDPFTPEDMTQAEEHTSLGPEYFAGRRIAEQFMLKFKAEHFKPLVEEFCKEFEDKLWVNLAEKLLEDTEYQVHQGIYRMVQGTVLALMTGEQWALDQYVLTKNYNGVKVRAAVASHAPRELQDARVADLEKKVLALEEEVKWFRNRR